jgi:hypothetical protein
MKRMSVCDREPDWNLLFWCVSQPNRRERYGLHRELTPIPESIRRRVFGSCQLARIPCANQVLVGDRIARACRLPASATQKNRQ